MNYNKEDDAIAYEDHFENEEYLIALSKTNRKVDSKDAEITGPTRNINKKIE